MEKETEFLELMNVLLSETMSVEEKKRTLEEKFHINMESKMEKELNLMCNLSDLVEERGMARGIARGMEQGMEKKLLEQVEKKLLKGVSIEDIADMLEESVEMIQAIVCKIKSSAE